MTWLHDNFVTVIHDVMLTPSSKSKNKKTIVMTLELGSGCNLGKDLSKRVGISQLVKHKDTGLYLQLYIPIDHE